MKKKEKEIENKKISLPVKINKCFYVVNFFFLQTTNAMVSIPTSYLIRENFENKIKVIPSIFSRKAKV